MWAHKETNKRNQMSFPADANVRNNNSSANNNSKTVHKSKIILRNPSPQKLILHSQQKCTFLTMILEPSKPVTNWWFFFKKNNHPRSLETTNIDGKIITFVSKKAHLNFITVPKMM